LQFTTSSSSGPKLGGRPSIGVSSVMASIFGCWHRKVSRPFTRQGQTYLSCLNCGARKRFDLNTWQTRGHFHHA
jgi:hypothetical protein